MRAAYYGRPIVLEKKSTIVTEHRQSVYRIRPFFVKTHALGMPLNPINRQVFMMQSFHHTICFTAAVDNKTSSQSVHGLMMGTVDRKLSAIQLCQPGVFFSQNPMLGISISSGSPHMIFIGRKMLNQGTTKIDIEQLVTSEIPRIGLPSLTKASVIANSMSSKVSVIE